MELPNRQTFYLGNVKVVLMKIKWGFWLIQAGSSDIWMMAHNCGRYSSSKRDLRVDSRSPQKDDDENKAYDKNN